MTRRRRLQQALALAASSGAWPLVSHAQVAPTASGSPSASLAPGAQPPIADAGERKVLRVLFRSAETSFDPARISDLYSRTVTGHIFESLYAYDPLARPTVVVPLTAVGMPEVSGDFRVWTVRIQPGIFFADDPAFGGRRREMVAQDHVYAFQRAVDPANLSPFAPLVLDLKIVGLAASRDAAKGRPYDYDRPIAGLQVLDRYTLRFTLEQPRPRFDEALAQSDLLGAQAREVVQRYGATIGEHPVGTGPFRLKSWRRSSRIVLERNPGYREVLYHGRPAPGDAEGQALLARFKGRRLPMVDEVDVAIVEEEQPRWLSFLNGEVDGLVTTTGALPNTFANEALPGGHLSPRLARAQVQAQRGLASDSAYTVFGMDDPIVGGTAPAQVALRRAISLAYDVGREIRLARRNQAVPANSFMLPHTSGYDPAFKSEMSDYDPARAKALLDVYGYRDRDGDGFRERPDGSPLELVIATEPDTINRAFNELWQKCLNAVGLRVRFATQQWAENLKAAEAGKLMMWTLGGSAASPDGQDSMAQMYGPQAGGQNLARFRLDAMDRLYERTQVLPDGPERERLFFEARRLAVAYMPYKAHVHRIYTDLCHPWLSGFRRPLFAVDWWQRVDVDPALRRRMTA
ncbi:MAG: bicyclomycin resistance protein [Ideonella sp.]|nr:bicyclomycin resistance protein [Ideonella sp.]MCC7457555.1 hypothetical protein [Nitrospira sp.]